MITASDNCFMVIFGSCLIQVVYVLRIVTYCYCYCCYCYQMVAVSVHPAFTFKRKCMTNKLLTATQQRLVTLSTYRRYTNNCIYLSNSKNG